MYTNICSICSAHMNVLCILFCLVTIYIHHQKKIWIARHDCDDDSVNLRSSSSTMGKKCQNYYFINSSKCEWMNSIAEVQWYGNFGATKQKQLPSTKCNKFHSFPMNWIIVSKSMFFFWMNHQHITASNNNFSVVFVYYCITALKFKFTKRNKARTQHIVRFFKYFFQMEITHTHTLAKWMIWKEKNEINLCIWHHRWKWWEKINWQRASEAAQVKE